MLKFKHLLLIASIFILFSQCVPVSHHSSKNEDADDIEMEEATPKNKKKKSKSESKSYADWNPKIYQVVDTCSFLSQKEKEIIIEVNKCRTNPKKYAEEVLVPYLNSISDEGIFIDSQGEYVATKEGKEAVIEAINALKKQKPRSILTPKLYLTQAARDHCADQGPKSLVGHGGSDGSSPSSRVSKYNRWSLGAGENIDYGGFTAEEIVRNLIVDDGVHPRGHRENLYHKYKNIGVGFGEHAGYRYMCVMDFD